MASGTIAFWLHSPDPERDAGQRQASCFVDQSLFFKA
jgi:hypothetical protein